MHDQLATVAEQQPSEQQPSELDRANSELHNLIDTLSDCQNVLIDFVNRGLGPVAPVGPAGTEAILPPVPVFNDGVTGNVRRGIYRAQGVATSIRELLSRASQIA